MGNKFAVEVLETDDGENEFRITNIGTMPYTETKEMVEKFSMHVAYGLKKIKDQDKHPIAFYADNTTTFTDYEFDLLKLHILSLGYIEEEFWDLMNKEEQLAILQGFALLEDERWNAQQQLEQPTEEFWHDDI